MSHDRHRPQHSFDVVVAGGGIAGLGVAWRCAQRGMQVALVDDQPGAGASHAAAGMLAPVTEVVYGEEALLRLNLASMARWPDFARELATNSGIDPAYVSEGTLAVAATRDDLRALQELHAFQQELGLESERLRAGPCRELEPALAPGVRGGLLVPGDHQVDNRAVVSALVRTVRQAGVEWLRDFVSSVDHDGSRIRGVALAGGEHVLTRHLVVATGAWTGRLEGLPPELTAPVRPVKGQIVRLAGPPEELGLGRTVRALVSGSSVYMVPRRSGEVVVGATVEEQGFDTSVTARAVHDLLRDALAVVPELGELHLVETAAGLRPGTPDNAPVLGCASLEGLHYAAGHHRNGFLLLPITAEAVAEGVETGRSPDVVAEFGVDRFARREAYL